MIDPFYYKRLFTDLLMIVIVEKWNETKQNLCNTPLMILKEMLMYYPLRVQEKNGIHFSKILKNLLGLTHD